MNILVIDGQGGKIGRQILGVLVQRFPNENIIAVGTNSVATSAMLKGLQIKGATGSNAVIANARNADIIVGPVGIVIADAMMGEISPEMAVAVGQSTAVKILLPMNRCEILIAGIAEVSVSTLIADALAKISDVIAGNGTQSRSDVSRTKV